MIEIGSIVNAEVTRVETYGVYLQHDGQSIIVLAPEISWCGAGDELRSMRVGQTLRVFILRFNYQTREFVGSLRRLRQDENPYRQLSRLAPDAVLDGQVVGVYSDGISIELENGARGQVPKHRLLTPDVKPGQHIEVTVAALDIDEGILTLEPKPRTAPHELEPAAVH